jgi:peptidoglycan/LPS O-acetylase OafA/YrhL
VRFSGLQVILGHTELLAESSWGIENISTIFRGNGEMTKLWFQIVPGGFFAVDLFFWIGGFLGSYVMLRKLRKISASSFGAAIPLLAVSRWLRLVPSVLLVLGAFWMVQPHVGNGPFWIGQSAQSDACSKYWWAEVFFLTAWKDEWNSW